MTLLDISLPIRAPMAVWPGEPQPERAALLALADGDPANVTIWTLDAHTGTHVDAPRHFLADGAGAEDIPPRALIGSAWLAEVEGAAGAITAAHIAALDLPDGAERILLRTRRTPLTEGPQDESAVPRLDGSGAQALIDRGPALIGIDQLSIGDGDAHRLLLGAGVVCLEGLELGAAALGGHRLVCTALKLVGSDGAPARAFLEPLA